MRITCKNHNDAISYVAQTPAPHITHPLRNDGYRTPELPRCPQDNLPSQPIALLLTFHNSQFSLFLTYLPRANLFDRLHTVGRGQSIKPFA